MADESHNFTTARTRLEEIVTQVRKKDTSLEKSLDLLEEGVRLANACTELIDRADWAAAGAPAEGATAGEIGDEPVTAEDASVDRTEEPVDDAATVDGHADAESASWAEDTGTDESEAKDDMTGADSPDETEAPEYDVVEDEAAQER